MTWDELREAESKLTYPGNQHFDPESLAPYPGETAERVVHVHKWIPELIGGESLLDIGSSKGFLPFYYGVGWSRVVAYEPFTACYEFCQSVLKEHPELRYIVNFYNGGFRDIPIMKPAQAKRMRLPGLFRMYDVVYCGSVHHHFYRDCMRYGAPPFLWIAKLKALSNDLIILDGPKDAEDPTCLVFAKEEEWTEQQKADFNVDNLCKYFAPQFQLMRFVPNERRRWTMVFKRVQPNNIPVIDGKNMQLLVNYAKTYGERIAVNGARDESQGVWKFTLGSDVLRLKLDPNPPTAAILMVLNEINRQYGHSFAETRFVLGSKNDIGDVAEWVDGTRIESNTDLWDHWVNINIPLSALGLIEPHFKQCDYVIPEGGKTGVDIDVDMVQQSNLLLNDYLDKWLPNRVQDLPGNEKGWQYIRKNISKPETFYMVRNGTYPTA